METGSIAIVAMVLPARIVLVVNPTAAEHLHTLYSDDGEHVNMETTRD